MATERITSIRISRERPTVDANLGFLAELAGTWEGQGFNLIARPDKQGGSPLFLELNQTFEELSFIPIASSIPNRGDLVDDIELFGLTYLQKISDSVTGGALHIEPGIWVHIPSQDDGATQSVARMGTIPHGNSLLAQGTAIKLDPFTGNPFDPDAVSFINTAPFVVGAAMHAPGTLGAFPPYDLSNRTPAAVNFRTPAGNVPAIALPDTILGVPMQDVILDPAKLLTAALSGQTIKSMVAIKIATVASLQQEQPDPGAPPAPPPTTITFNGGGGGIENIPFLQGNADAATVFATFWIEKIQGPTPDTDFLQLQYIQTVLLNFPVVVPGSPPGANLSWPHVSVATLQKTFGGQ
ncbi:MAG: heme-binding protein [Vulcanimicrobiaceae bacterium]